jgi:hypothetical protein
MCAWRFSRAQTGFFVLPAGIVDGDGSPVLSLCKNGKAFFHHVFIVKKQFNLTIVGRRV